MMEWFTGVIEDINDPAMLNRVKVRCIGIHTSSLAKIPTEALPWAIVMMPTTSAGVSGLTQSQHGLLKGSWVVGFFRDGLGKQDPVIMGSIASKSIKAADTSVGFNDPTGQYPKETHVGESDVNRLARNELKETDIVKVKTDSVTEEVEDAKGATWNEPVTPYAAEYPFNKVYESESGHINEIDDTEGAERLHEYHKSGTFKEIHPDGSVVTRVVMDNYEIIYGDNFCNVKGSVHLTIDQDCTTHIKGNWDVKVAKNMNIEVGGDLTEKIKGNVTEDYGKAQKVTVGGDMTEAITGKQTTDASGNITISAPRVDIN
jgi:hypothetical protein